MYVAHDMLCIY